MVDIVMTKKCLNLEEDLKNTNIYGFALDNAICLFDDSNEHLIVLWNTCETDVYDVAGMRDIDTICALTNLCEPQNVIKVFYSGKDYTITAII